MKGYRTFLMIFGVVFIIYIIAEVNKPTPVDWSVTLSKDDKIPYGGYVLFQQLKDLFPDAVVHSYRQPPYNQLNNYSANNSAYIITGETFAPTKDDWHEIENYVSDGNYIFISAFNFNKLVLDSLHFNTFSQLPLLNNDSTSINFVNPLLKSNESYTFKKRTIDDYFSKVDTTNTIVLGTNNSGKPNFIQVTYGDGSFFIHADPVCFSNYFMLFQNNAEYTAKALSYLPKDIEKIYWDEFYKLGPEGASTPLRFFLSNEYLRWALRLALFGLILYILFEMKRRQRIIPVITPLRNSTLDFVKTVSGVYYHQKDNAGIAQKKIGYFLDYIRQRFYLQTQLLDEDFVQQLTRKSGIDKTAIQDLVHLIAEAQNGYGVPDKLLIELNYNIDNFYKQSK